MRRRSTGHHILRNAQGRRPESSDFTVAPGLRGDPFDGVIAVLFRAPTVIQKETVDTLRSKASARVLRDYGVPEVGQNLKYKLVLRIDLLAVWCAEQNRWPVAGILIQINIRR